MYIYECVRTELTIVLIAYSFVQQWYQISILAPFVKFPYCFYAVCLCLVAPSSHWLLHRWHWWVCCYPSVSFLSSVSSLAFATLTLLPPSSYQTTIHSPSPFFYFNMSFFPFFISPLILSFCFLHRSSHVDSVTSLTLVHCASLVHSRLLRIFSYFHSVCS